MRGRHLTPVNQRTRSIPLPPAKIPRQPTILKGNKPACAEWRRLTKILEVEGLITELDGNLLAGYCLCYSRYVHAVDELVLGGEIVLNVAGQPCINPWAQVRDRALKQLVEIGHEFGLSPAARAKIKIPGWMVNREEKPSISTRDRRAISIRRPQVDEGDETDEGENDGESERTEENDE